MSGIKRYKYEHAFRLESGDVLPKIELAYQTWGNLSPEKDNAIMVFHALTGNSEVTDYYDEAGKHHRGWWRDLIGKGKAIDTEQYYVICSNVLGSCYGSTGPASPDPLTNQAYKMNFPTITIEDMVKAQALLVDHLGIEQLNTIIGGSLGGMQALKWAVLFPEKVERMVMIAAPLRHSAWATGLNEVARQAVMSDPDWKNGNYEEQPANGLKQARMLAMMSYRSHQSYESRFGRHERDATAWRKIGSGLQFEIESYLHYQGNKLVARFDANAYLYLTKALDLFDISKGYCDSREALSKIQAKTLVVGISSDLLYPVTEIKPVCNYRPDFHYSEIDSIHGHDAFLIESEQLGKIVNNFMQKSNKKKFQFV